MVYNFLPFMVLPIYNVLIKIDSNVINAARDLGANPVQTFCKVIFPSEYPGCDQRYHYGICTGTDNIRYLRPSGRR